MSPREGRPQPHDAGPEVTEWTPRPLAQGVGQQRRRDAGLWRRAPLWRNLSLGATLLTVAAATALLQTPAPEPPLSSSSPQRSAAPTQTSATPAPPTIAAVRTAPTAQVAALRTPAPPSAEGAPSAALTDTKPRPQPTQLAAPADVAPSPQVPSAPSRSAATPGVVAPAVQEPAPAPQTCRLSLSGAPGETSQGVVVGVESRATSLARIPHAEAMLGGAIDPAYVNNTRFTVSLGNSTQVFIAPASIATHIGDRVLTQGPYRNPNLPCNYVPPLITADLGAASGPAAAESTETPPPR
jgi:hypothetical protein